jgi:hypothetical protein
MKRFLLIPCLSVLRLGQTSARRDLRLDAQQIENDGLERRFQGAGYDRHGFPDAARR